MRRKKPRDTLAEVERYLAVDQPELTATLAGEVVVVTGTYCLQPQEDDNLNQGCLANFDIQVFIRPGFPLVEPVVREVGGKVPRSADYHINDEDGTCCLEVWESWLAEHPKADVASFFEGPLRNFFLSQVYLENHEKFPFGEHEHYEAGRLAAYAEQLGCDANKDAVVKYLQALAHSPPRGHWDCPCGSGKRLRSCCRTQLQQLAMQINPALARQMLLRIVK